MSPRSRVEGPKWLLRPAVVREARLRLFCFPYAGKGASMYARWPAALPPGVEVCAIQMPGRETRIHEAPARDLVTAASELAAAMEPYLDRKFALFGHSMGAILAFETARALRRHGREPAHLFVSGHRAPHLPSTVPDIRALPDAALIAELQRRYDGIPDFVMQDPELRALYLGVIRADLEMLENYRFVAAEPLACGISAFGGRADEAVAASALEGWREQTRSWCGVRLFAGDHFFVDSGRRLVAQAVADRLQPLL